MKAKKVATRKYYKNYTQTFNASSSFQTFTVPSSIFGNLNVDCVASRGMQGSNDGGNGGRVQCMLPVSQNQTLYIYVGSIPSSINIASYNASDIRTNNNGVTDNTSLQSRLVVAGGGGNSTSTTVASGFSGGAGGGLTGGSANNNTCGSGGTQSEGGAKGSTGSGGSNGSFGLGGGGGSSSTYQAGAGGAGWYGGGGGNYSTKVRSGSGGGGSSYTDPSCSSVIHTQGYNNGTGYITIAYTTESTQSDYDFYKDFYEVKVIKETINNEDKFYGVNEYKRGQYYGN